MRNTLYFLLGFTLVVAAASAFAGEYETKFVPDGMKLVLVPKDRTQCVDVKILPLPEAPDSQPSTPDAPCVPEGELGYGPGTKRCPD